jgi:L-methionine (R)-S-oxide reductase
MADRHLRDELMTAVSGQGSPTDRLDRICALLLEGMPSCQWAGFYVVDPSEPGMLVLGPFAGEPTEHVRIRFGEGVCGQAAAALRTFIIDDVAAEPNYLSCSPAVRSEIVVPVFHEGRLVGELDLDSHTPSGFSSGDGALLGWLAEQTGGAVAAFATLLMEGGNS